MSAMIRQQSSASAHGAPAQAGRSHDVGGFHDGFHDGVRGRGGAGGFGGIAARFPRLPWDRTHREPVMPRPGDCVLRLRKVGVSIGEHQILHDVDLDVRAGELLALVGPNGAGKSTLMGAITGDVPLSEGRVELFGHSAGSWDPTELAMRRSVLLQSVDVTFPFSVEEIVRMGRSPWEGTAEELDDDLVVESAMAMTEVSDLRDRVYTSLSGGERGRAAFSRVLSQAAPVLLLDEPTAAMDIKHQEMLMRVGREYAASGCAVVVIVHALDAAAAWADRVALLETGRIRAVGTPEEVFTSRLLSEVYQCPIEVLPHPDGGLIILPRRPHVRRNVYGRHGLVVASSAIAGSPGVPGAGDAAISSVIPDGRSAPSVVLSERSESKDPAPAVGVVPAAPSGDSVSPVALGERSVSPVVLSERSEPKDPAPHTMGSAHHGGASR